MSWPHVTLGDAAEIISGATPASGTDEYWDGPVAWATPTDLSRLDAKHIQSTERSITEQGLRSCAARVLPPRSVLFSSRAPIGLVAVNTVPMATNQGFKSFVPGPRLDADYLYWWLQANRRQLQDLGNGATFKEVSKAVVSRVRLPLPPVAEQRRIAAILDKADAIRRNRSQALIIADQLVKSVFRETFGDLSVNSVRWPTKKISELVSRERPVTYGILMPGPDIADGVPYVRVTDMRDGGIVEDQVRRTSAQIAKEYRRSTLQTGDLLISIRGHVGRLAFVPASLDGANITQDTARLAIPDQTDAIYVRSCLEDQALQRVMAQRTKGGAVKGINLGDLKEIGLPMAPAKLRTSYAEFWLKMQATSAAQKLSLREAEEFFASLSQRAFRAEL